MTTEPASPAKFPVLATTRGLPAKRGRAAVGGEQRDLLCALAYVSLGIGNIDQAVSLLDIVVRDFPDDPGVLKLLAYAHVAAKRGDLALAALDSLSSTETEEDEVAVLLLRSQALRLAGNLPEGQACFRRFVEARRQAESVAS